MIGTDFHWRNSVKKNKEFSMVRYEIVKDRRVLLSNPGHMDLSDRVVVLLSHLVHYQNHSYTFGANKTFFSLHQPLSRCMLCPAIPIYFEAFSRSAAHSAAPTVLVNEKAIDANGTISRANAAMPSLVRD